MVYCCQNPEQNVFTEVEEGSENGSDSEVSVKRN